MSHDRNPNWHYYYISLNLKRLQDQQGLSNAEHELREDIMSKPYAGKANWKKEAKMKIEMEQQDCIRRYNWFVYYEWERDYIRELYQVHFQNELDLKNMVEKIFQLLRVS